MYCMYYVSPYYYNERTNLKVKKKPKLNPTYNPNANATFRVPYKFELLGESTRRVPALKSNTQPGKLTTRREIKTFRFSND